MSAAVENVAAVIALPDCAERLAVAVDAAWEIEALASMLQGVITPSVEGEYLVVRGVSMRMQELAGIVMSAVDDAADTLPNLRRRLTGASGAEGGAA